MPCECPSCVEIAISSDDGSHFCWECEDAGCCDGECSVDSRESGLFVTYNRIVLGQTVRLRAEVEGPFDSPACAHECAKARGSEVGVQDVLVVGEL